MSLLFATGNDEKFLTASTLCGNSGIILEKFADESLEIQSEDPNEVMLHKLQTKFQLSGGRPVVVSDDSWEIPALGGFPGPYMKSVVHWFSPQNFIDLTKNLTDKTINMHMYLGYKDQTETKVFHNILTAKLVGEARGSYGNSAQKVTVLDIDSDQTISEIYDAGKQHAEGRHLGPARAWNQFITWYLNYSK
jgi:inosine/xanthosine triphosphate pyrophosphatase family protein